MADEERDEVEFGLVMPFVACASQGGAFDDGSFVAGYRCGSIDAVLSQPDAVPYETQAREADLAQLDLIAMRHGVVMQSHESGDEWFTVRFAGGAP